MFGRIDGQAASESPPPSPHLYGRRHSNLSQVRRPPLAAYSGSVITPTTVHHSTSHSDYPCAGTGPLLVTSSLIWARDTLCTYIRRTRRRIKQISNRLVRGTSFAIWYSSSPSLWTMRRCSVRSIPTSATSLVPRGPNAYLQLPHASPPPPSGQLAD